MGPMKGDAITIARDKYTLHLKISKTLTFGTILDA